MIEIDFRARDPHHYYRIKARDNAHAERIKAHILQRIAAGDPYLQRGRAIDGARISTQRARDRARRLQVSPKSSSLTRPAVVLAPALRRYGAVASEGLKRGAVASAASAPAFAGRLTGSGLFEPIGELAGMYIPLAAERLGITNRKLKANTTAERYVLGMSEFLGEAILPVGGLQRAGVNLVGRGAKAAGTLLLGAGGSVAGGDIAEHFGLPRWKGEIAGGIIAGGSPTAIRRAVHHSRDALGAFGPEFSVRQPYFPPTPPPPYKGRAQLVDGFPGSTTKKSNAAQQRTAHTPRSDDILHPMPAQAGQRAVRDAKAELDSISQLDFRRAVGMLGRLEGSPMYKELNRFMMADLTPGLMWDRILKGGHFLDARKVIQDERSAWAGRPEARRYLAALNYLDKALESVIRRQIPGIGTALRASQGLPIGASAPRPAYPPAKSPAQRHFDRTGVYPEQTFTHEFTPGYPDQYSPRPAQPMHLPSADEYAIAEREKRKANKEVRDIWGMYRLPYEVHEIQSVRLGGGPSDPANKVILPYGVHREQMTPYWNPLMPKRRRRRFEVPVGRTVLEN